MVKKKILFFATIFLCFNICSCFFDKYASSKKLSPRPSAKSQKHQTCGVHDGLFVYPAFHELNFDLVLTSGIAKEVDRVEFRYMFVSKEECTFSNLDWIKMDMTCAGNRCRYVMDSLSPAFPDTQTPICKVQGHSDSLCYTMIAYSAQRDVLCMQEDTGKPFFALRHNKAYLKNATPYDECSVLEPMYEDLYSYMFGDIDVEVSCEHCESSYLKMVLRETDENERCAEDEYSCRDLHEKDILCGEKFTWKFAEGFYEARFIEITSGISSDYQTISISKTKKTALKFLFDCSAHKNPL